jgi:tetratricopeptide (TPR) repeat protein
MRPSTLFSAPTFLVAIVAALAALHSAPAPLAGQSDEARAAADSLRAYYFRQDFAGGSLAGGTLVARFPDAPEVSAWHAINLARTSGRAQEALDFTQGMLERWPGGHWSLSAHAVAVSYQTGRTAEGVEIAEEAFALAPHDPHTLWVRGLTLHRAQRYDDVVALADSVLPHDWAELLVLKANALLVSRAQGEDRLERAMEVFAEARAQDPENVNAHFFPASNLLASRNLEEGLPLIERAVELSPYSAGIRQSWFSAVQARRDLTAEEKRTLVESEISALVAQRPTPDVFSLAASFLRQLGAHDGIGPLEDRILREFPESVEAEWVVINRHRALRDSLRQNTVADPEEATARARDMLWEFVGRPSHRAPPLLGDVYLTLFMDVRADESVPPADLLRVVEGMVQHNRVNPHLTHVEGPLALAERGVHFREAEAIAREGLDFVDEYHEPRRASLESMGEFEASVNRMRSMMHDALGWVYFHEGRYQEAREELERAYELSRENAAVLYHLGRLAEAEGDLDEAEIMFSRGRNAEVRGGAKRSTEALEKLYETKYGSLDGYEEYIEALAEVERADRRARIASTRLPEPEAAPSFQLEWLHGGNYDSTEHAGKITVINFWGVWCGPCVMEAPQIQQFHEHWKDDPDVVFLTIDFNDPPDRVREWMAENGYDFPVLLDDGFVGRAGVNAFPTTWFLDGDGLMVFRHIGASNTVYEEFVWRVEMLKEWATAR